MATRGGRIRISIEGDHSDLDRSVDASNRSLSGLKKGAGVGATALRGLGQAAKYGAVAVGALAVVEIPRMIDEAREAEKVTSQTNAVIKSTGGIAKVTAEDVGSLAEAISLKAGIDDESVQAMQNQLLTFTNIRNEVGKGNDVFNQATQAVTDVSVAMGKDLNSTSIMVGKALNDPIAGISAMSRVGIQFTEDQKEMIAGMVESGDVMGAQKVILGELETQFGGSAAAQADASDKLKVAWENLEETAGTALLPILNDVANAAAKFIGEFQKGVGTGGDVRRVFEAIGTAIGDTVRAIRAAGEVVIPALVRSFNAVTTAGRAVVRWIVGAANDVADFVSAIKPLAVAFEVVKDVLRAVIPFFARNLVRAFDVVAAAAKTVWVPIRTIGKVVGNVVEFVVDLLRGDFRGAWDAARDLVRNVVDGIVDFVKAGFGLVRSIVRGAVDTTKDIIRTGWQAIRDVTRTVLGGVFDFVKNIFNRVVEFIRSVPSRAKDAAAAVARAIIGGVNDARQIVGDVADWLGEIPGRIRSFADRIFDAAAGIGGKIVGGIKDGLSAIPGAIKSAFTSLPGIISDIGNALANWINDNTLFGNRVEINLPGPAPDIGFTIPQLAKGGEVSRATLAMIGEAGREYVIPVENNQERGRALLMDAAADLGIPFAAGGMVAGRGKGKGGKGKGGKKKTIVETDPADVIESSSELAKLMAFHARALRTLTGNTALQAPRKPTWADPTKYEAAPGTWDDLETAVDLLNYWDAQVRKYEKPQTVQIGETWKVWAKNIFKTRKKTVGKGKKRKKITQWLNPRGKWVNEKTPWREKGAEIPKTRKPVNWSGMLYDVLENAYNESAGWTDFISGLFDPIGDQATGGGGETAAALQQVLDAQTTLNERLLRAEAIRNAQDPILSNFLGSFDTGGVVPGPRGRAGVAVVHGGETIVPTHRTGGGNVVVEIHGDPSLPDLITRVDARVDAKLTGMGRRTGIGLQAASATGVRARMRNTRRTGGRG